MKTALKGKQLAATITVAGAAFTLMIGNAVVAASDEGGPSFAERCEALGPDYEVYEAPGVGEYIDGTRHCMYTNVDGDNFGIVFSDDD